jgi:HPt (histidine-containing phosphotransfer) domain-containing protein
MQDNPIDKSVFTALEDTAGAEFVAELVGTFLDEAPPMLAEIRRARDDGSAERFRRAAHSLKSNSNTFGAMALGRMAKALELGGIASVGQGESPTLDDLDREYARVAAALKNLRHV